MEYNKIITEIYEKCPCFESSSFTLRFVSFDDCKNLLRCYSDNNSRRIFNNDNCTSDFYYDDIHSMKECINFFIQSYKDHEFVRFSIIDKMTGLAVGTMEMYGKESYIKQVNSGILRIDLCYEYETENYLKELVDISNREFFSAFNVNLIATKIPSFATVRRKVFNEMGYRRIDLKNLNLSNDYYYKER